MLKTKKVNKYLTKAHELSSEKILANIAESKTLGYTYEDAVAQQKRNSQ